MNQPVRDAMLAEARAEREAWDALLDEIGVARMSVRAVAGDWSPKDVLAHITAYLRYWGAQAFGVASGIQPTTRELFDTDELPSDVADFNLDQINARIQAQYATFSVGDVRERWDRAYDRLIEGLSGLSEDDLTAVGRYDWAFGRSIVDAVAGSTYRHAARHAAELRAWLDEFDS